MFGGGAILNHMVEGKAASLDRVFHSLADPTRRSMLAALARGPCSIGQLAAPHEMSFAAASKHVKVLEAAGLLQREIRGREHLCQLSASPLSAAHDYLASYATFWTARLDALEALLLADAPVRRSRRGSRGSKRAKRTRSKHVR
jgi:DNA-binding transcriptional ArsR family regulator